MPQPQILSTVIDIGGQIDPTLGKALKGASGMLSNALGKAGLIGLAGAAGVAAKKLADDYLQAFRYIRLGTGATGKALKSLMEDYRKTLAGSSASAEEAAHAVADLNTAYGATGETLQEASKAALIVSKRFGEDLGGIIKTNAQAVLAWGRNAEDAADSLNYFRKVSQATGMSITELQSTTADFAPQLKALGYSMETGAALLGKLAQNGVKGAGAMSALNKIATMGANAWGVYYEDIKNAADETAAINLAAEVFGKEGGPRMAAAIRGGAFEAGELARGLATDSESLQKLDRDLMGADDYLQRIQNTLSAMLQPAVQAVLREIDSALRWWESNGPGFFEDIKKLGAEIVDDMLTPIRAAMDAAAKLSDWWAGAKNRLSGKGGSGSGSDTGAASTPAEWQDVGMFAAGGWATQPSICGEAGPEAVISLDPAHRAENVRYWQEAGRALGVGSAASSTTYDLSGMVFAPTIQSSGEGADILGALRANEREFADAIISALDARAARVY